MSPRKPQPRAVKSPGPRGWDRGLVLGGLIALWMLGLVARLYDLQVIDYVDLLARAQRQQQRTIEIAPKRGSIFDRQMNALALSVAVDSVYSVPSEIADPARVARRLAPVLGLDASDLVGRFKAYRSFCWVKRKVTEREARRVQALNLRGIYFQKEPKRFYPKGELAANVLGYVGVDDRGLGGLEYGLDAAITGRPGRVLLASDARRRTFHSTEWPGRPGKNIVLTLDETVQYIAEKALAEAVLRWRAAGGAVVVQNPNTGEILAMASQPTFNPNAYAQSSASALENRATSWLYEPGSTFKLVPVSAALEEGLTRPEEIIDCQQGAIVLAGHTIHDDKPHGALSVTDVVAESSDVGAVKLGLRLGEDRLYRYIRSFGFGAKTGVDLPGEERGLLRPPQRWSGISIGELSIGQEVGVTPLQIVTAYSAIANGGILFEPRIVHDISFENTHDALPPAHGRRVVSERTAATMRQMLTQVVEHGTGTPAQLSGWSSAGKTGTAQKIDASGAYSKSHYVASFVGFAPAAHPAVTILVVIDTPVGAIYGKEVAAPVFKSIAEQTLSCLSIPHDNPSRWPQFVPSAPAGRSRQTREARTGFLPRDSGRRRAATSPLLPAAFLKPDAPEPDPPTRRGEAERDADSGTIVLNDGPLVEVPSLAGLSARQVAEECQKLGLELNLAGTGLAIEQNPPAHALLPARSTIWVQLGR